MFAISIFVRPVDVLLMIGSFPLETASFIVYNTSISICSSCIANFALLAALDLALNIDGRFLLFL